MNDLLQHFEGTVESTDERYVESKNIAYMTTLITQGQGKGVVIETGDRTLMGSISKLTTETVQRKTSLQKEITRFVVFIVIIAVSTVVVLLIVWGTWLQKHYPTFIDLPTMVNINYFIIFLFAKFNSSYECRWLT